MLIELDPEYSPLLAEGLLGFSKLARSGSDAEDCNAEVALSTASNPE